jgi:hypothetical protein
MSGSAETESKWNSASTMILFALIGAILGFGLLYADWPFPDATDAFTATGEYHLWVFLICGQCAFWAAALIPISSSIRGLVSQWRRHWREVSASVGLAAILILGFVFAASAKSGLTLDYPLPYHRPKLTAISVLGGLVALAGVAAIALIHSALSSVPSGPSRTERQIDEFLRLQAELQRLLTIEGVIIGAAILSTGALRNAILAYGDAVGEKYSFPPEYVLVYGAYFSGVLALIYMPTYRRLLAVGRGLRDSLFPLQSPRAASWSDWYDRRKKFEDLLKLQLTSGESFRAGVAILTPLIGSFVALLLGAS